MTFIYFCLSFTLSLPFNCPSCLLTSFYALSIVTSDWMCSQCKYIFEQLNGLIFFLISWLHYNLSHTSPSNYRNTPCLQVLLVGNHWGTVWTCVNEHAPSLVLFGALAAVEFRGGAGPWASGTSRTQQGGHRQEFSYHPVSLPLFLHCILSFSLPCCSPLHRLLSGVFLCFIYILQFKVQGSYGGTSAYIQYTQTSMQAWKRDH